MDATNGTKPDSDTSSSARNDAHHGQSGTLRIATSFDSEGNPGDNASLHIPNKGSLGDQIEFSERQDDIPESDFEILPDEDDVGDFAELPQAATNSSADLTPQHSPSSSPPTTPITPSRKGFRVPGFKHIRQLSTPTVEHATISPSSSSPGEVKEIKAKFWPFPADGNHRTPFKALRARAAAAYRGKDANDSSAHGTTTDSNMIADEWGADDGSSSEDLSDESEIDISEGDESYIDLDATDYDHYTELVECLSIAPIPNSFLDLPPDIFDYLDPDVVHSISQQNLKTYAFEHHLFAKGLLRLLAERELVGVEGDIHDMSNVIKMGPLTKKSSRGLWTIKYVEIREGNLSYFDDTSRQPNAQTRKTVHLRKRNCRCEIPKDGNKDGNFVFELVVDGGRKSLWMAKSEEERQAWIRAVKQGMIGGSRDRAEVSLVDVSLYQTGIEAYRSAKTVLHDARTRQGYHVAVDTLLFQRQNTTSLQVPMQWIRAEIMETDEQTEAFTPFQRVKSSMAEELKCLGEMSVLINDALIEGSTPYSAERVFGTLSRCILEFDKVDSASQKREVSKPSVKRSETDVLMTEIDAVSYARRILVGVVNTSIYGDITNVIQSLAANGTFATVTLDRAEPLHIDVSFAGDDYRDHNQSNRILPDLKGWLQTRSIWGKVWKRRYFVLSEGVLSYFEQAEPRPHGLRGQLVLNKCQVSEEDSETLKLQTHDEERYLRFDNRDSLEHWKPCLEHASIGNTPSSPEYAVNIIDQPATNGPSAALPSLPTYATTPLKNATETGVQVGKRAMKVMKGAKHAGMKKFKNAKGRIVPWIKAKRKRGGFRSNSTREMLVQSTKGMPQTPNQKREPTVQVVVERNYFYKVMATGTPAEPMLLIRVKLYQAFLLSGGANGKLSSGDELIELEFLECEDD
eukprot:Nitzschia sp. Nitz4//scaffold74_size92883//6084//8896//NITZ4_004808-RA/size92883-augustus-gene-0.1-mRNA-1//1//CDS//3329557550//3283//frame0